VNGAVHAVKLDGKCNEAHKDLIRHHGMSPVATSAELYHVYRTWNPHAAELCISIELLFIRGRGAEHAVKLDGKCDETHRGQSPVTTRAELYDVYYTWESPRRCTSQTTAVGRGQTVPVLCTISIAFTPGILPGPLFDVHEGA